MTFMAGTQQRLIFLTLHEDADYARAALDASGAWVCGEGETRFRYFARDSAALADRHFVSPTLHLDEP